MDITNFVIPAIDIRRGKVVRLFKGKFEKEKVYGYTPAGLAEVFNSAGFKRLHVVDLDGAKEGFPENLSHILKVRSVFEGKIEVGGGLRSYEAVKSLLEEGIDYVVIGTMALKDSNTFERILTDFPNRVILSLDARRGRVAIGGWLEESSVTPMELAQRYDSKPIWGYLYTLIERDGSLGGVDVKPYTEIKSVLKKPVLASGGVSSLEDVKRLHGVVDGVVVGKAIYEGRIPVGGLKTNG